MLGRIFPKQLDNAYRGYRLAIWLLVPIVLLESVIGTNSIINTRTVAMTADGIPLDRFGGGGAETVIALFAMAGLFRLVLAFLGIVVLVRYRAMIPLMYLLLLILHLGGRALLLLHPIATSGVASANLGSAVIFTLLALQLLGFVLSLLHRSEPTQMEGAS